MSAHHIMVATALAASLVSGVAAARGSHSDAGDSYINDAQRNPRFIEPYADLDPSRGTLQHPREGYYLRQRIAAERDGSEGYRGQVRVRPYSPYGY